MGRGETDEGLKAFEKALSVGGENKETLNNFGSACAEYGLLDVAVRYFERALELDPDYVFSLTNLGKLCIQAEQYEKALKYLKRAAGKRPQDYETNWLIAQCLRNLGRIDDALARLEGLAQIAPQSAEVFREMGMIYLNDNGDMETARRMFARSLSINPNQPELAMFVTQQPDQGKDRTEMPEAFPPMPDITPPMPRLPFPEMPGMPSMPRSSPP